MVSISKLTNSDRKYGLTENGNKYKKCNVAKNIATGVGVAFTLGMVGEGSAHPINCTNLKPYVKAGLGWGATGIVFTILNRAIFSVIDNSINKNRMAQADGEAVLKEKMKNGKLVG